MNQTRWLVALAASLCAYGAAGSSVARAQNVVPGNAATGEALYSRCLACHALAYDRTGPRHCGLFGRRAGSVPGYAYSQAMKESKIVWDDESLNLFLKSPMEAVPGTSMGYAGISSGQERADVIAYLKKENASATCADR
ncbi:cytochrome c family protein [Pollutimonas nitritireducens]|uniref:Cytochrome c family protein n=1 Tax=Pollutimonas nitritireducens TaxID=2045209 RepID=A0A2N4UK87_9BURK|nr:cytochrome c family protein [Pollutimonas nitritireducens]PLC55420.1 cytochrome c family protein [Pollutimonas nitritireducens]